MQCTAKLLRPDSRNKVKSSDKFLEEVALKCVFNHHRCRFQRDHITSLRVLLNITRRAGWLVVKMSSKWPTCSCWCFFAQTLKNLSGHKWWGAFTNILYYQIILLFIPPTTANCCCFTHRKLDVEVSSIKEAYMTRQKVFVQLLRRRGAHVSSPEPDGASNCHRSSPSPDTPPYTPSASPQPQHDGERLT